MHHPTPAPHRCIHIVQGLLPLVLILLSVVSTHAVIPVDSSKDLSKTEFCEINSCAAASKRLPSIRQARRAMDAVSRHIGTLRSSYSRSSTFAVTAVFPSRVSILGGETIHVCGFGFTGVNEVTTSNGGILPGVPGATKDQRKAKEGSHPFPAKRGKERPVWGATQHLGREGRLFCHFRLNQTSMAELSILSGISAETEHDIVDTSPIVSQAGIHKRGSLRGVSPGGVPSFKHGLTAAEAFYSKYLTTPARALYDGEVVCDSPDIRQIPIGFPVTAEVTLSVNGKEQFHQMSSGVDTMDTHKPRLTFYDQRLSRSGHSSLHDYKSSLGRSKHDIFKAYAEQDLSIIRKLTADKYETKAIPQNPKHRTSRGAL